MVSIRPFVESDNPAMFEIEKFPRREMKNLR